jgi:hypothetical protein
MRDDRQLRRSATASAISRSSRLGFPKTRFQGSKLRFLPFLRHALEPLAFETAVDVFGGTGAVSYLLKRLGRRVHYNDALLSNHASVLALIENGTHKLGSDRARGLFERARGATYESFIQNTFKEIFYLDEENASLDVAAQNIARMGNAVDRALARHALFQACLMKRPFNLLPAGISRAYGGREAGFGNKATWGGASPSFWSRPLPPRSRLRQRKANATASTLCRWTPARLPRPAVRARRQASFRYLGGYHFLERHLPLRQ